VEEEAMTKLVGENVLMRIFIGEGDKFGHRPLFEALVELLKREGFAGATVLRGIAGFGAHSVYHTDKLLRLSQDLPVIVEVVDTQENVERVMPKIDEMMCGGLITIEKVTVTRYSHKHQG
jgi:PII-like signaling protein